MVSIIVTTHNYGHFLADALISVREQTFTDWECIVIDSGSTDNTKEIVEQFVLFDKRYQYFYQLDKGVSAARNSGIKISKGEYIQFLDGDDLLQKNKIAEQERVLKSDPLTDIVYSDARFFDDASPELLRNSKTGDKPDDWMPRISGKGDVVLKYLRSFNFLVTHSPLIKRSVIERSGLFDENMAALEDWDFWLRCAFNDCYFRFHSASNDLALVRVHKKSLSRRLDLMLKGNFIMLEKLLLNEKVRTKHKIFFMIKYSELFWDTFFSKVKLPKISINLILISVLLFPVWLMIKFVRKIQKM